MYYEYFWKWKGILIKNTQNKHITIEKEWQRQVFNDSSVKCSEEI